MTNFSSKLDVLIAKAAELREVGVLSFEIDGNKVELAPKESELPADLQAIFDDDKAERDSADPMGRSSTYGLPDGAALPGFAKLINDREQNNDR